MKVRHRILVVEDDRETAALIAEELTDRGYEVEVAHDGRSGYSAIVKSPPRLVLSDVIMPVMSGLALLQKLTEMAPRFCDTPFIFVTAATDRDTELRARRFGADDFVTKPIDFELLAAIISCRLSRTARIDRTGLVAMSDREREVLTWSARGKTSGEIAVILGLSKRTVDFHLDNARNKLGASNRLEAAIKAATYRLIEP